MHSNVRNRSDGVPFYIAIREDLASKIKKGVYLPGSRIPPEGELTKHYDVSRMTIRHAIDDLVNSGLLLRRQGIGTFVLTEQVRRNYNELNSFFEEMSEQGLNPSSTLLNIMRKKASVHVAKKLNISEGDEVYFLERLRNIKGNPIAINEVWIPASLFPLPTEKEAEASLYEFYKRNGYEVVIAEQQIQARLATKEQAFKLNIKKGAPILYSDRVTYTYNNVPIERVEAYAIGDHYSIEMILSRKPN